MVERAIRLRNRPGRTRVAGYCIISPEGILGDRCINPMEMQKRSLPMFNNMRTKELKRFRLQDNVRENSEVTERNVSVWMVHLHLMIL